MKAKTEKSKHLYGFQNLYSTTRKYFSIIICNTFFYKFGYIIGIHMVSKH